MNGNDYTPLPCSEESEKMILGVILLDNSLIRQASELLQIYDFYNPRNRQIFRAMLKLAENGQAIDPILLGEDLKKSENGLIIEIAEITQLTYGLPYFSEIQKYTDILRRKTLEREVIKEANNLALKISEVENVGEALQLASENLKNLASQFKENNNNFHLVRMSDVQREEISWLWFPFIALSKLTLLSGEEGLGKSWFSCALANPVTNGCGFPPNFEPCDIGNVLMLSAEDGLGDTIKPRLEAVGANCERVFVIDEPLTFDEKGLLKLQSYIAEVQPKLITIDPLFAYTPSKTDINSANQSRAISSRLAEIARKWNCAILLIRHIGKAKGFGDARAAGLGSIDWRAAVRSELLVGKNPDNEKERAIVQTKNNLAEFGDAVGFTIENNSDGAKFLWMGRSNLTALQILANVKDEDTRAEQSDAIKFLSEVLRDGEKYSKDVQTEARQNGISERTLARAKTSLNVQSRKEGFNPTRWFWQLPEDCHKESEDCQEN